MASEIKANKISPATGTAFTLGDSGDTFTVPSGATLSSAGSITVPSGGSLTINSGATIDVTNATKTGFPATSLEVIKTVTNTSDSATIDVTDAFSASYGTYAVYMTGLYPVTNGINIYLEMGDPDLATGVWADLPYFMGGYSIQSSSTFAGGYGTSYAIIGKSAVNYSNVATPTSYWMWIFNPYNADVRTQGKFDGASWDNTGNWMMNCEGGFVQRGGTVGNFRMTDFRIRAATGNMEGRPEAKIVVYGVEGT
jgi:hypothetical protein